MINPDFWHPDGVDFGPLLTATGGRISAFADSTPGTTPLPFVAGTPLTLEPLDVRVFTGSVAASEVAGQAPSPEASRQHLERLAADRVVIERVAPELDGGRFPVKRIVGDVLTVEADIFADGHDKLGAAVKYRGQHESEWREVRMRFVDNDRWAGSFPLVRNTRYVYTVEAWRDLYTSWRVEVGKKHEAGLNIGLELIEGRRLIERSAAQAQGPDADQLRDLLRRLEERQDDHGWLLAVMLGQEVQALMERVGERTNLSRYGRELEVVVDRTAAAFASWYELFPRSMSDDPQRHGTFDDVVPFAGEQRSPYSGGEDDTTFGAPDVVAAFERRNSDRARAELIAVEGMGHEWPTGPRAARRGVDATQAILEFFGVEYSRAG